MKQEDKTSVAEGAKKTAPKNPFEDYFAELDLADLEPKIEDMFKSGVHFGHHKSRKNPKMDEYIFATKNNVNIFDLEKTKEKLKEAMDFTSQVVAQDKEILFVGTKKQAKKIVEAAAGVCQMPSVTQRWLGGTFTNFEVVSKRLKYLRDELEKVKNGEYAKYTKFEQMKKAEELSRMEEKMGGIKNMTQLPGAVFVASIIEDGLAVKEAKRQNIPVVALVDTNVDPKEIDYPIPANEDAVSSLRFLLGYMAKAVLDGKEKKQKNAEGDKNDTEKNKKK